MGKYLEIAQKALSQTPVSIAEGRCTTEDQQLKGDSDAPVPFTHCEISELSEISPVTEQELKEVLEDDWVEVSNDPAQLEAARYSMFVTRQVAAGQVPESFTAIIECHHCGKVPAWPGYPTPTNNCPWCLGRVAGRLIPGVSN